ncbi:hypothetical protein F4779DRAFT_500396 [Xylariaceae sp. FL0662B]|nr:hypothetical protein F4779DRAFT_500396 [Xylariaceae sp. FL0662B]
MIHTKMLASSFFVIGSWAYLTIVQSARRQFALCLPFVYPLSTQVAQQIEKHRMIPDTSKRLDKATLPAIRIATWCVKMGMVCFVGGGSSGLPVLLACD